jgi:ABC-type branched-subunit amino acid transport system ATPase component
MARVLYKNIIKRFGDKPALNDISLEVDDKTDFAVADPTIQIPTGCVVSLLGPSACGKTTTMRMIAGLEKPTEGRIWIDDKDVTYLQPKERDIAMVFQLPDILDADILKVPIQVPEGDELGALGCAITAAVAIGIYHNYRQAVEKMCSTTRQHEPNPEAHEIYMKKYDHYNKIRDVMRGPWDRMYLTTQEIKG